MMVFMELQMLIYAVVSIVWRDVEVNLYGTSQPSIVDAVVAFYVAHRINCWVTEEAE